MFAGLNEVCPKMEDIVIGLHYYGVQFVEDGPHSTRYYSTSMIDNDQVAMRLLTAAAQKALDHGYVPNATHFAICGQILHADEHRFACRPNADGDLVFTCFYRIEMLRIQTTIYLALDGARGCDTQFVPRGALDLDGRGWMLYNDPETGDYHDLFSKEHDTFGDVYRGISWVESPTRTRLPAPLTSRFRDLLWMPVQIEEMAENFTRMRRKHPWQIRWWYLQEQLGRRLIEVRTLPGVSIPEVTSRERPKNEADLMSQLDADARMMFQEARF